MTAIPVADTRPAPSLRSNAEAFDWRANLPRQWHDSIVAPISLMSYRDYEMAAERIVGHDEDEAPCYCRSRFVVTETRSEDDEEFYQVATYAEAMTAWRLRDGRWLTHRLISRENERGTGFYSLGDRMPR